VEVSNPVEDADRTMMATALLEAERTATQIPPLTDAHPEVTVADAYAIQQIVVDHKVAGGQRIVGHKVGLSALAMQQMLGVDEPDFGHLLDGMVVDDQDEVEITRFCQPRVEFEVAFVLDRPLTGPSSTIADVLAATRFVMPSIEIIDSRFTDWKIALCDTVADNASSAGVVLGGTPIDPIGLDLRTIGCVGRKNGEVVATGAAGAVLGNPARAVAWLANTLFGFGVALEAGQVVIPGSCTAAVSVEAGDSIRADFDRLGHVSVNFV
jgi:2-keto-4-pentenoate hydratase